MKLWDIVKTVGGQVIKNTVPGGGLIVDALNAILPGDKKLPSDATGDQINEAVQSLPPEQRAALLDKEFDVELTQIKESNSTLRTMLESDAKNQHSTRPYIAKGAFQVVGFVTLLTSSIWGYAIATGKAEIVKATVSGWPFILSVIGPLVTLLLAYFGVLKKEQKDRLDAASGSTSPAGLVGVISGLFKKG